MCDKAVGDVLPTLNFFFLIGLLQIKSFKEVLYLHMMIYTF